MLIMIQEAYVSYEIAKLLNEKGFDEPLETLITPEGSTYFLDTKSRKQHITIRNSEINFYSDDISCPTQQMALSWLRQEHHLHIIVCIDDLDWSYQIINFENKTDVQYIKDLAGFNSYENAVNAAIEHCLINLISK